MDNKLLKEIKGKLIVSCQGYNELGFHSAEDMLRMANAASVGGCVGFRLNSPEYVSLVRKHHPDKCIIAIWKKETEGSNVYITPDAASILALYEAGADIVALDATLQKNYLGEYGWQTIKKVKELNPSILIMADISTFEEAKLAYEAGADIVATTLSGYTSYTSDLPHEPDYELISKCKKNLGAFVVCEGKIWTREEALKCYKCGADLVVVGSAITNPIFITERFVNYLKEEEVWQ